MLMLDQATLHLLGRKHALETLRWLTEHPAGCTLTEIDYGVIRSHPSTRSIVEALHKFGLVKRDENKKFTLTQRGTDLLRLIQVSLGWSPPSSADVVNPRKSATRIN